MKVLIADGSRDVAERLVVLIQEIPMVELLPATSTAQETLESIQAHNPEILVIDARIPGAHGTELLKSLRRENSAMVLIVLSNHMSPQYREHYEAAGADVVVDKSHEFNQLDQLVRILVGCPEAVRDDSRWADQPQ